MVVEEVDTIVAVVGEDNAVGEDKADDELLAEDKADKEVDNELRWLQRTSIIYFSSKHCFYGSAIDYSHLFELDAFENMSNLLSFKWI